MDDQFIEAVIVCTISMALGVFLGIHQVRGEAIKFNHAYYATDTGDFTWAKDNKWEHTQNYL